MKVGYIQSAVSNEDRSMEREQEIYRKYLDNAMLLDEHSWNRLVMDARNFPVEKGYLRHKELAMEIEEARGTISPLPELIRSVKIRTVTMGLVYTLLTLTIFGLLCLGILGTLLLAQVLITTTECRQRRRNTSWSDP